MKNVTPRQLVAASMKEARDLDIDTRDFVTMHKADLESLVRNAVQQGFQLGKETAERNATRPKKLLSKRHDKDFDAGKVHPVDNTFFDNL
jgi:hypothetical protein